MVSKPGAGNCNEEEAGFRQGQSDNGTDESKEGLDSSNVGRKKKTFRRVRSLENIEKFTIITRKDGREVRTQYARVYEVKTRNMALCGKNHNITGVPYVNKNFYVNGKYCEGVFPEFHTLTTVYISDEAWSNPDRDTHRNEAKKRIHENCMNDPKFKEDLLKKRDEMLENITNEADKDLFKDEVEQLINGTLEKSRYFNFDHCVSEDPSVNPIAVVLEGEHSKSGHTGTFSIDVKGNGALKRTNRFKAVSRSEGND